MSDHEIIPPQHPVEPRSRIYLAVMWDGEFVWKAPRQSHMFCHEANLIVLSVPGGGDVLELWKERFGLVPHGTLLTPVQAGLLAAAHVVLAAKDRSWAQNDVLREVRRQLSSSMKLLGE